MIVDVNVFETEIKCLTMIKMTKTVSQDRFTMMIVSFFLFVCLSEIRNQTFYFVPKMRIIEGLTHTHT